MSEKEVFNHGIITTATGFIKDNYVLLVNEKAATTLSVKLNVLGTTYDVNINNNYLILNVLKHLEGAREMKATGRFHTSNKTEGGRTSVFYKVYTNEVQILFQNKIIILNESNKDKEKYEYFMLKYLYANWEKDFIKAFKIDNNQIYDKLNALYKEVGGEINLKKRNLVESDKEAPKKKKLTKEELGEDVDIFKYT